MRRREEKKEEETGGGKKGKRRMTLLWSYIWLTYVGAPGMRGVFQLHIQLGLQPLGKLLME